MLSHLHDCLRLLSVDVCQLVLPKLHVALFGRHRLLCHSPLALSLHRYEHVLHFLQLLAVLLRNILDFPRIVELDQVNRFLDILEFLLVAGPESLILSTQVLDPLDFLGVVFFLLNERRVTHCCILLTSTFFWMVYLVSCLCFFRASFSFCNCKRSSYTRFRIVSTLPSIFFNSFFSFTTDNSGFILRLSPIRIINLLTLSLKIISKQHNTPHIQQKPSLFLFYFEIGNTFIYMKKRFLN